MMESVVTSLNKFSAPYGKEVTLENVAYENGMRVLRVHIREGNRFTVMDIDENAASDWGAAMTDWATQTQK
ncbi:MAG: hypothetical protein QNK19_08030 [Xanthomonadales bacterium]|nr:hypothetical protein [Xanthomonadales bacterium]